MKNTYSSNMNQKLSCNIHYIYWKCVTGFISYIIAYNVAQLTEEPAWWGVIFWRVVPIVLSEHMWYDATQPLQW